MSRSKTSSIPNPAASPSSTSEPSLDRSAHFSTLTKRLQRLRIDTGELLFDFEVSVEFTPADAYQAPWMEEAVQRLAKLHDDLRDAEAALVARKTVVPDPVPAPATSAAANSTEAALHGDGNPNGLLHSRRLLADLVQALNRALQKQPRITGNLRFMLRHHHRDLVDFLARSDAEFLDSNDTSFGFPSFDDFTSR